MRNIGQMALAMGLVVIMACAAMGHGPCPGPHYYHHGPSPYGVRAYYAAPVYVAPAPVIVAQPMYAPPPVPYYYAAPPAAAFQYHNRHWGLSIGF